MGPSSSAPSSQSSQSQTCGTEPIITASLSSWGQRSDMGTQEILGTSTAPCFCQHSTTIWSILSNHMSVFRQVPHSKSPLSARGSGEVRIYTGGAREQWGLVTLYFSANICVRDQGPGDTKDIIKSHVVPHVRACCRWLCAGLPPGQHQQTLDKMGPCLLHR